MENVNIRSTPLGFAKYLQTKTEELVKSGKVASIGMSPIPLCDSPHLAKIMLLSLMVFFRGSCYAVLWSELRQKNEKGDLGDRNP